jgi:hypothetical protein
MIKARHTKIIILCTYCVVLSALVLAGGRTLDPSERRLSAERTIVPLAVQSVVDSYNEGVRFIVETETDLTSLTEIEDRFSQVIVYPMYPDAIKDMRHVNSLRIPLSELYQTTYETLPIASYEALRAKGDWDAFFARYGHFSAYMMVSRVGFNEQLTEATIYIGVRCGSMCGTGSIIYFSKQKGSWIVVDTQIVWMS